MIKQGFFLAGLSLGVFITYLNYKPPDCLNKHN
jgi:hypothetical protein